MGCLLAAFAAGASPGSLAEMSGDDYRSETVITSDEERERVRRLIEEARVREAERQRLRQMEEAARQRRLAEAEARRPPGERLVIAHCTGCHEFEQLMAQGRTRLGWWLTVARMRHWNGADIPGAAAEDIVRHLAEVRPATQGRAVGEFALVALPALAGVLWLTASIRSWRAMGRCRRGPVGRR